MGLSTDSAIWCVRWVGASLYGFESVEHVVDIMAFKWVTYSKRDSDAILEKLKSAGTSGMPGSAAIDKLALSTLFYFCMLNQM